LEADDLQFAEFTFDHTVNGVVESQGRYIDDRWCTVVETNEVERLQEVLSYRKRWIERS
jgi:hypothetical protein